MLACCSQVEHLKIWIKPSFLSNALRSACGGKSGNAAGDSHDSNLRGTQIPQQCYKSPVFAYGVSLNHTILTDHTLA